VAEILKESEDLFIAVKHLFWVTLYVTVLMKLYNLIWEMNEKVQTVQSDSFIITSENCLSSHTTDCRFPGGHMKEKDRERKNITEPTLWPSDL